MEYLEKKELTEEIKQSTKQNIKNCVIYGFAILLTEILLQGGFMKALASDVTGFEVLLWTYLYAVVRYVQFGLIASFKSE